jgi:group I intron endonuclease
MGIIYLIKNNVNNKLYVGQTIRTLQKRWGEHCNPKDSCVALKNAIQKYSPENFTVSVIIEAHDDLLDELEQNYIIQYNSLYPNGYNIQTGGNKGKKHCNESCERMRQSKLGNKNPNYGKPRSDDTKTKISNAKSGEKHHFYGKILSLEHRLNLSKSHKELDLPMYMVYLKERPKCYQGDGYAITNHPNGHNKHYTSKKLSLEQKYQLALNYLNGLGNISNMNAVQRLDGSGSL